MKYRYFVIWLILLFIAQSSYSQETEISASDIDSAFQKRQEAAIEKQNAPNEGPSASSKEAEKIKTEFNIEKNNLYDLILSQDKPFRFGQNSVINKTNEQIKEASERFEQSNVTVAYKNYQALIESGTLTDFHYMQLAWQLAEIGFYSLSEEAMNKISYNQMCKNYNDIIEKYYFPKYKPLYEEEIFLANIYTSIHYNNLTRESVFDLMKKDKLIRKSDYANYLAATALFSDKDYARAGNFINKALSMESENVKYLILKAKILTAQNKYSDALKIVSSLEKKKIISSNKYSEIDTLKYYILSKSIKNEVKAKYYLAYYFYLNNDNTRALNELSTLAFKAKSDEVHYLMGEIYFGDKDYPKAFENYTKALTYNKRSSNAYKGLAKLYLIKNDYNNSLNYYLKAFKLNRNNEDTASDISALYLITNNLKEAKKYCDKTLFINSESYKGYFLLSKLRPDKSVENLKKSLIINPFYLNTWIELSEISLTNNDAVSAEKYLQSVGFINSNDYRYYYLRGKIAQAKSQNETAEKNFKEAVSLFKIQTNITDFDIPVSSLREIQ